MFLYIDRSGYFWSSTQISGYKIPLVYGYMLDVTGKSFYQTDRLELDNALSVRCIKNLM